MKKMDGLELVQRLKQTTFRGRVMVLTGYLNDGLEASYRSLGVNKIMDKPFDPRDLRNAVLELMEAE